MSEHVHLRIPARPRFTNLARIAGVNLGQRLGWSIIDIDQLREALDCSTEVLVGPVPQPGALLADFTVDDESLTVELTLTDAAGPVPSERVSRFQDEVAATHDDAELDAAQGRVRFSHTRSG